MIIFICIVLVIILMAMFMRDAIGHQTLDSAVQKKYFYAKEELDNRGLTPLLGKYLKIAGGYRLMEIVAEEMSRGVDDIKEIADVLTVEIIRKAKEEIEKNKHKDE